MESRPIGLVIVSILLILISLIIWVVGELSSHYISGLPVKFATDPINLAFIVLFAIVGLGIFWYKKWAFLLASILILISLIIFLVGVFSTGLTIVNLIYHANQYIMQIIYVCVLVYLVKNRNLFK